MNLQHGCMYPKCNENGVITFALVPLCARHYVGILNETHRYYRRQISLEERQHYYKITYLIPWRHKL